MLAVKVPPPASAKRKKKLIGKMLPGCCSRYHMGARSVSGFGRHAPGVCANSSKATEHFGDVAAR